MPGYAGIEGTPNRIGPVSYTHLHKVGHVTLQSGIAGGADVILLPEIPYDIDKVAEVVENRFAAGKKFSIIAVAEGAISKEDAKLKKKQYKACLLYTSSLYPTAEIFHLLQKSS